MKKRTIHGIDITAPGGIAALMDFHRLTFGDAVMEVDAEAEAKAAADKAAADKSDADGADDKLGEGGLKALQAEREARAAAEKELAEFRAEKQKAADAELSEVQRANKVAADVAVELAAARLENARLAALAKHSIPEKYQGLVHGTDADSYMASALLASELAALAEGKVQKTDVVHKSGTGGGGDGSNSSTTLDAGRDLYASQHKKTTS